MKPQRFRYRYAGKHWEHGVCIRMDARWKIVLADEAIAWFDEDPWEVMGQLVGGVDEFEWLDADCGWHGDVATPEQPAQSRPADYDHVAGFVWYTTGATTEGPLPRTRAGARRRASGRRLEPQMSSALQSAAGPVAIHVHVHLSEGAAMPEPSQQRSLFGDDERTRPTPTPEIKIHSPEPDDAATDEPVRSEPPPDGGLDRPAASASGDGVAVAGRVPAAAVDSEAGPTITQFYERSYRPELVGPRVSVLDEDWTPSGRNLQRSLF